MTKAQIMLGLDVGSARIGVARGDTAVKIAVPLTTVSVDGTEYEQLRALIQHETELAGLVVGYPRNQSGQTTAQTDTVERVAKALEQFSLPVVFQDESLTSVIAEQRLKQRGRGYAKTDIDAEAAAIILQDYLERTYGH